MVCIKIGTRSISLYNYLLSFFRHYLVFLSLCFRFLFLDVFFYSRAGIGCLIAGVVDVLNCFRVTLEMVPAVAEESDDQKWYTDPELSLIHI